MGRWLKMLRHTIVYCTNCQQRSSVLSFNVHTSGSAARHPSLYLALRARPWLRTPQSYNLSDVDTTLMLFAAATVCLQQDRVLAVS